MAVPLLVIITVYDVAGWAASNGIIVRSGGKLSRNKEWEKIDDYLGNMESIVLDAGEDMTGNKVVDALLYQKRKWAEKEIIRWECDVQIPKKPE